MQKITLYVDGACSGNPGKGGWGCYAIYAPCEGNQNVPVTWSSYGGKKLTTNNQMELSAILNGLKMVKPGSDIVVIADTQYGLKGLLKDYTNGRICKNKLGNDVVFTGWVKGWVNNGWRTAANKPVVNKELWIDIMAECKRHVLAGSILTFKWVKGHSGNEGNDIADGLANLGKTL